MVVLAGFLLAGCGRDDADPDQRPHDSGAVDYCERFGWYGDGHCDEICDTPDPDCSEPTNNISPGPVPEPPEPPECRRMGPETVEDSRYIAFGDTCETIDYACADGWVPFADDCGCGCDWVPPLASCDQLWERGSVEYVSQDPDSCAEIRFTCADDAEEFFDAECGCGCITPWDAGPGFCLDDSKPDVERLGDLEECLLVDFFCEEGSSPFYDDCGCGCRLNCSDDFECPNGYCQPDADNGGSCVYPVCDDGTEVVCNALPPTCYDSDVLSIVNGCYECLDARTCGPSNGP